ncbi:hypothetical protein KBI23_13610 [bacterium]|nr:hypothetical protein [bacterium]MBP9808527.1 hypothetical protein [bacterium]
MKLPPTIKDKLSAALGLSLVCGLVLPLAPVQAASKKAKPTQAKPSPAKGKTKSVGSDAETSTKPNKSADPALEAKPTPKKTEDQCPACGRG